MSNYPRVALGQVPVGDGLGTTHPVVAVDAGNGRANCVTLDKGWSLLRKWEEVEVEHELVVYSPEFPQEQAGWQAVLRQIAEAQPLAARWEDQYLDEEARHHRTKVSRDALKEENDRLKEQIKELEDNPLYVYRSNAGFGEHYNPVVLEKDIEDVELKSVDDGRWWLADGTLVNTPEYPNEQEAREAAEEHLSAAAGAEAVARAIEKEREDRMQRGLNAIDRHIEKIRIKNNQKDDDA